MSEFTADDLLHLKRLCRIACTPEEEKDILLSLSRVLEYVHNLSSIDTENVRSCNFVLKGLTKTTLREDETRDLMPRDQFLANAPDHIGGMIRVPQVLKPQ
jgi:aspartyl-tRNA(Asn)/glutamyl-tRNA(Gln) amidotransferase subunit C